MKHALWTWTRDPFLQTSSRLHVHVWWLTNLKDNQNNTETCPMDNVSLTLTVKNTFPKFPCIVPCILTCYPFGTRRKQRKISISLEWQKLFWSALLNDIKNEIIADSIFILSTSDALYCICTAENKSCNCINCFDCLASSKVNALAKQAKCE